jgi:hypothetical protein
MLPLILSSDSHVFEPPYLWQTRIDAPFRDRAPRIERIDGADQIVVEADSGQRPPPHTEPAGEWPMRKYAFRTMRSTQS